MMFIIQQFCDAIYVTAYYYNTSAFNACQIINSYFQIQGAIMVASVVQVVIGLTGIMGFMLRFIGPLAITPTVALIGLALFQEAGKFASQQWWIALVYVLS